MAAQKDVLYLVFLALAVRTVRLQLTSGDDQGWAFIWDYNGRAEQVYYDTMVARWNYNTNLTLGNSRKQDEANFIEAHFDRQAAQIASSFDWQNFSNATLKRLFRKITLLGTAVNHIEQAREAREYNNLLTEMRLIYSTGEVCEYHNPSSCLVLEPGTWPNQEFGDLIPPWDL
ncbi:angiotensin-converting enzyme 2-like [Branchiostoma floridae x Branchiostoma belcheri]